jgi:DNA modification methylase
MSVKIICGDMLVELPKLDADSIDACVTDPPYHLTQASRGGSPLISLLSRCPALL